MKHTNNILKFVSDIFVTFVLHQLLSVFGAGTGIGAGTGAGAGAVAGTGTGTGTGTCADRAYGCRIGDRYCLISVG